MYFDGLTDKEKKKLAYIWKSMDKIDKEHFINQVALFLSVVGDTKEARELVSLAIKKLIEDGSNNLSDIGFYFSQILSNVKDKHLSHSIRKAYVAIEAYRLKYDLPPIPHKTL